MSSDWCSDVLPCAERERLHNLAKQNNDLARMNAEGMKRATWRAAELANALETLCDDAEALMEATGNRQAENTIISCRALLRRNDAANGVSNVE